MRRCLADLRMGMSGNHNRRNRRYGHRKQQQ
jgi:hypothetical protein